MRVEQRFALALVAVLTLQPLRATYTNFEVSQVHPIALTPSGARLLVVNTPDALLEVFAVAADGRLAPESSIPVGLEPVTVVARTDSEAWVVNHLSDTVSIVDLDRRTTVKTPAVGDEPPISMTRLRQGAEGPITFLCATLGSGVRLGGDRDEDTFLNGSDCAPDDARTWNPAGPVSGLGASGASPTLLGWDEQGTRTGPSVRYDVAAGTISGLRASGPGSAGWLAGDLSTAAYEDGRPDPPAGDGYFCLVRAGNSCASGGFGPAALDTLACTVP